MEARIYNTNIDVVIEGETLEDILEEFYREYPSQRTNVIFVECDVEEHWVNWTKGQI